MRQLILRFVKFFRKIFGHEEEPAPSVPPTSPPSLPTVEAKPVIAPPIKITEPELGLETPEPPQYRKRDFLFTYQERKFYERLVEVIGNEYQVFAKVRMADVVWLANEPVNRKYHNNQIQCKHFDFVLCDKAFLKPALVLELDDSSHDKFNRQESDEFKQQVCEMVGLPLVRVKVQQSYSGDEIGQLVRSKI
jgi:hypothetical protein